MVKQRETKLPSWFSIVFPSICKEYSQSLASSPGWGEFGNKATLSQKFLLQIYLSNNIRLYQNKVYLAYKNSFMFTSHAQVKVWLFPAPEDEHYTNQYGRLH